MTIRTHLEAKESLLGFPLEFKSGEYAKIKLVASEDMKVDDRGLIHGGFTFGVADYAAMVAINHPNVVLGASEVKFTAPVVVGDVMLAFAKIVAQEGRRRIVDVKVTVNDKTVLKGNMTCFILDKHVSEIK
jgi:acyl-coenzyme A thioesterase PaaI-like protein